MNRPACLPSRLPYVQNTRTAVLALRKAGMVFRNFESREPASVFLNKAQAANYPKIWRIVP